MKTQKYRNKKQLILFQFFIVLLVSFGTVWKTLINCLAYIDLNPLRAGLVELPEKYRWNSLGYHIQTNNLDNFLSTDFGLKEFNVKSNQRFGWGVFIKEVVGSNLNPIVFIGVDSYFTHRLKPFSAEICPLVS
ncbi:MAG: hypothetical protein WBM78_13005 [Desulfobacterales bacterium]